MATSNDCVLFDLQNGWNNTACMTKLYYPWIMGGIALVSGCLGLFKQSTSHLAWIGSIGVPFDFDAIVYGEYKVYAIWYLADAISDIFWAFFEDGLFVVLLFVHALTLYKVYV